MQVDDILKGYGVLLRNIAFSDLDKLRMWRNRHDIRSVMKHSEVISESEHLAWFEKTQSDRSCKHWSIVYKSELIGSANIVACSGTILHTDEVEPGLYIGDERFKSNILAFAPSLVLCDYCFYELEKKKLVATVAKTNQAAINYNVKLGYVLTGEVTNNWCQMTLERNDYEHATQSIKRFLSR